MAGEYRLQVLLELREHTLLAAKKALSAAAATAAQEQAAQRILNERLAVLRQRLRSPKQAAASTQRAADLQAQARFEARLRAELREAEQAASEHRAGPLLRSETALARAQAAHLQAQRDVELVSRHREAALAEADRRDERLREDEVDDWLRAQRPS
jgi:hypothetical protein